ncbi:conserved hypothetical protein [Perkinsus marinus ATCC 50983]|uniref:ELMO domain-containing protein n=1 Tax=Perkinsus marinus (strain ATCC 50983 / TXsc) TaxID=423536 RepID=C5L795_PERM5|nr:conserved hypothetical protein [Perkinsus marinus ATCC 50983]EER07357.1 conserved hypothetical protein [Perkinsus marinus ATCC 50983]|eukprot:XP_002775541.1 conserved hypothetical protein [Perkinsus marinus ATCC 50983]
MSSLAVVSPSGGTTVLPIQAHYEAMEGPAAHQPSSSHTTASCGGPGRSFKERCCFSCFHAPRNSSSRCRRIKEWFNRVLYKLQRWWKTHIRACPPLTPVEEGLLGDLTRVASVENSISEESMNSHLIDWWTLVTADVGSAPPELPRDERWKAVGFQSACPSTDLRTGPHALLCMVQAARAYTSEFREMVAVSDGYCLMDFNQFHYPFAATAINVHFMLLHYLGIVDGFSPVTKDAIVASGYERKVFASALALTNGAFEDLFTATCMAVHSHWTRMVADEGATLMDFQESLAFGLNRAASALVKSRPVEDLPSWHRVLVNICISFPPPHTITPPV